MTDSPLLQHWQRTKDKINDAKTQNHARQDVTLLAVSKTKPSEMIRELIHAGQRDFGENYLQEALEKINALAEYKAKDAITWHYIGHIQRNKTRDIAEHFDWVQTLERDIIAKRLNDQRPDALPPLQVLIQVNIDDEDSKSGCTPEALPELVAAVKDYERLRLRGLMIIPATDSTDAFVRTQALFDDIKARYPELTDWDTLSMGMSGDMQAAIAHGSTMVRVGSAIFGARD